jgi:hypothetical protein
VWTTICPQGAREQPGRRQQACGSKQISCSRPHLNTSRFNLCRSAWLDLGSGTNPFCRLHLQCESKCVGQMPCGNRVACPMGHPAQAWAAAPGLSRRAASSRQGGPPDEHLCERHPQALRYAPHGWVCQLLGLGKRGVGLQALEARQKM